MRREIKCMRRKVRIAGGMRNYVHFPQYNNGNYETAAVRTLHGRCGKDEPAGREDSLSPGRHRRISVRMECVCSKNRRIIYERTEK